MCPHSTAFTTERRWKLLCIFSSNVLKSHLPSSSRMGFHDGTWLIMGCLQNWGVSVNWGYSGSCNYLQRITLETLFWGDSRKMSWRNTLEMAIYVSYGWEKDFRIYSTEIKSLSAVTTVIRDFSVLILIFYKILWFYNFKSSIKAQLH